MTSARVNLAGVTEMASMRVLVTGSADGLGRAAALGLQKAGHLVVVQVRNRARLSAVGTSAT